MCSKHSVLTTRFVGWSCHRSETMCSAYYHWTDTIKKGAALRCVHAMLYVHSALCLCAYCTHTLPSGDCNICILHYLHTTPRSYPRRLAALRISAKLAHPSLIAFTLALVLFIACALLAVQMSQKHMEWAFTSLCD